MPRSSTAVATLPMPSMSAAVRMLTFSRSEMAMTSWKLRESMRPRRSTISSSVQKSSWRFCNPLEIRDDNPPCVGEDVGHERDAAVGENPVGFRGRRSVGAFHDHFAVEVGRIDGADLVLDSRGNEHIAVEPQKLLVGDGLPFDIPSLRKQLCCFLHTIACSRSRPLLL